MTARESSSLYLATSAGCTRAVRKITGVVAVAGTCRSARSVSRPSMPGIMTSRRIRSGRNSAADAMASRADPHTLTV